VLAGRVAQRDGALIVSAELIDVTQGSQLWGERYNRRLADLYQVEEEIAKKISESLRVQLSGRDKERVAKRFTENSEAYQSYLRGRYFWNRRTPEDIRTGYRYFQQAIENDASYALAYSGLADCYSHLCSLGVIAPKEAWAKAKAAAALQPLRLLSILIWPRLIPQWPLCERLQTGIGKIRIKNLRMRLNWTRDIGSLRIGMP
jgi:hypothetical protein